ncbi:MAG: NAD(P)/FAD-dependent oxidoreductase [Pseudomonadota bacterium]|nr:NAD(P)/FAD-dependent oxidoreductase [Pseudomonadota bacterium]
MSDFDACIVGAGVIGLAVARALARSGRSVLVVEARAAFGEETSSRNSEVIHSGIYYPTGSLKALMCVAGRAALYDFCGAHGVPHARCGKLIVAADESELAGLEALARKGAQNGVDDLRLLSAREAKALEPALAGVGALLAPATGIIDSHASMLALQGDAAGAVIAYRAPFLAARREAGGFVVEIGGAEPARLTVGALVNAAGLAASRVARAIEGLADIPETRFAKGNYFALRGRAPFRRLIYPAPQAHGLGVHLTFDLAGQARFGPDVEWVETVDYHVNPERARGFAEAIRRYWPALPDDALSPAYAGVRPKISGPSEPAADFRIDGSSAHGFAGLVNLYGIESPGLTASLAIAERVAALL